MAHKMFDNFEAFHNHETRVLLTAPVYFIEDDGHQETSIWNLLSLWQKLAY